MKRLLQVLAALVVLSAITHIATSSGWSVLSEAFAPNPVLAQEPTCEWWCGEVSTGMKCMKEEPDPPAAGPYDECETVTGSSCGPDCTGCDVGDLCDPHLASAPALAPSGVALYAHTRGVRVEDGIARTLCGAWVVALAPTGYVAPTGEADPKESRFLLRL